MNLHEAKRSSTVAVFNTPQIILDSTTQNYIPVNRPFLSYDGERLYSGGSELSVMTRVGDGFTDKQMLSTINSARNDGWPVLSADELTIYWASDRTDGEVKGNFDIWTATRSNINSSFSAPRPLVELNSDTWEIPYWVSIHRCEMYLSRQNIDSATDDIYLAVKTL